MILKPEWLLQKELGFTPKKEPPKFFGGEPRKNLNENKIFRKFVLLEIAKTGLDEDQLISIFNILRNNQKYADLLKGYDNVRLVNDILKDQRKFKNKGIMIRINGKYFIIYENYDDCVSDTIDILANKHRKKLLNVSANDDLSEYETYISLNKEQLSKIKKMIRNELEKKGLNDYEIEDMLDEVMDELTINNQYFTILVKELKILNSKEFVNIFGNCCIDLQYKAKEDIQNEGLNALWKEYYYTDDGMIIIPL